MATYSICPVGFPEKEGTALEAIFTIASNRMRNHWRWVTNGNAADVYMVWVDCREQWGRYQAQYPHERMLAFSLPEAPVDARWQIRHLPGRVPSLHELIQALDTVGDELAAGVAAPDKAETIAANDPPPAPPTPIETIPAETVPAPSAPEAQSIDSPPPVAPASVMPVQPIPTGSAEAGFDPDHHLLGLIRQAQADGVPRWFADETSGAFLFLDASQDHFFAPSDVGAWLSLLSATKDQILTQPMDTRRLEAEAAAAGFAMRALEDLIFLAALMGSQGRLWVGADPDAPVHLKRWPNLKSLPGYSDYVGLVAFMNGNTADLKTIAERTGLPLGKVIDFHNGCMALNLLDIRDAPELREKTVNPALRSLFGKIAQRLRDGGPGTKSDNTGESGDARNRSSTT